MEQYDYIDTVRARQMEARRVFRQAELAGLTTLQPEPRRPHWFARVARGRSAGSTPAVTRPQPQS
jgi:hypothetical protein